MDPCPGRRHPWRAARVRRQALRARRGGAGSRGGKRFLAIEDGVRESTQGWREVLLASEARGLGAPRLATGDGATGFRAAPGEIFPAARQQRCRMHKTGNVLNYMPKRTQPKVKKMLHDIWQAETREDARGAFDLFVEAFEAKCPKAAGCLAEDRDELLAFHDFPARHWPGIRTSNPIESAFPAIRHRTKRAKGCLGWAGTLRMMSGPGQCAEKSWRRPRGFAHLADVIRGVDFTTEVSVPTRGVISADSTRRRSAASADGSAR